MNRPPYEMASGAARDRRPGPFVFSHSGEELPVGSGSMGGMSKRPFWMHEVVDAIAAAAMIAAGLQSPTPLVPSVVGGVIMLNAAITSGPLSAFRVLDRRVHRVVDIVVIAFEMIAAAAQQLGVDVGNRRD